MNDQRLFDLAMKVTNGQATPAERAELDARVSTDPALKAELERLHEEARLAKEVLPLISAISSTEQRPTGKHQLEGASPFQSSGEDAKSTSTRSAGTGRRYQDESSLVTSKPALPGYARERLRTKVREAYGTEPKRKSAFAFRWWALAGVSAALAMLLFIHPQSQPTIVVQVAMLDTVGNTRGGENPEIKVLEAAWKGVSPRQFSEQTKAAEWEKDLPASLGPTVFKVIYDRTAAEVRVVGRVKGKPISKSFVVEKDLAASLKQARDFIDSARTQ